MFRLDRMIEKISVRLNTQKHVRLSINYEVYKPIFQVQRLITRYKYRQDLLHKT